MANPKQYAAVEGRQLNVGSEEVETDVVKVIDSNGNVVQRLQG